MIDDDTVIGGVPKDRRHFTSPDGNVAIRLSDLDEPYRSYLDGTPAAVELALSQLKRIADLEAVVRDLIEVAFDGPSEPKDGGGNPHLESYHDWKARVERQAREAMK